MIQINISNRAVYTLIALALLLVIGGVVYAYTTDGSGSPSVMGHSADEIEGMFTYVGVCQATPGTTCKCNNGEKIMVVFTTCPAGYCAGWNQNKTTVYGQASSGCAGDCWFSCFK